MAIFHWKLQRISAILLVPVVVYVTLYLLNIGELSYADVVDDVSSFQSIFLIGFMALVLFTHSSLGIETILEDYIHDTKTQSLLVNLSKFFHAILFLLTLISLIVIKGN
ncbi:MAG: succinate dehydrogenase, hydrophobic membrane anchor protein [Gammaproteobacteria bacterium]|jgi:succinate dehydrogenase / fumarate reductase, membrane anchor subunit|nr:succinate dehydrogenase, hydrophobic membrane anchor protein [Gammaproteobacteria bacterium]MBT4462099.1 succinate dehydrogenase, hydrophobic membrane anchor protein [Gammaproteobacteria bacterium]MBT4654958.1 succinate dehydrogenase, hydrophobic membrane anchor protein [Gammaproteobacteria bacterium]MBT5116552.1 succinate dehydrogenase, hydrophobic membrane anchor protein [Gammaproteobacteria bacterium]MBT5761557.1 succinate dehydrogenase, hydrophobic membrane anchor protein [Gammaproteobac